jgi:hypothetical protein
MPARPLRQNEQAQQIDRACHSMSTEVNGGKSGFSGTTSGAAILFPRDRKIIFIRMLSATGR